MNMSASITTAPRAKIGDRVETDFGPGTVLDIYGNHLDVKTADDRAWVDAARCTPTKEGAP
jgi:hypothetical protein